MIIPITFPARPVNGGRLELAPAKRGMWFAEPKYNGWRVLAHAPSGTCFNRHGAPLTISGEFAQALKALVRIGAEAGIEWFDCEGLERRHAIGRGALVVLDAIVDGSYAVRRERLAASVGKPLPIERRPSENAVVLAPSFPVVDALSIYERLREINREWKCDFYEGVVMKRADSSYPVQLRSATEECRAMVKHRFLS